MPRQTSDPPGRVASALLCEFCVKGTAVTWRVKTADEKAKRRLQAWRNAVIEAASFAAGGAAAFTGEIDVEISEFSERQRLDRDNMAKPILDALKGVLYSDDRQVLKLHVEWCNIQGSYEVRFVPFVVAAALSDGSPFVWLRILRHQPRLTLKR